MTERELALTELDATDLLKGLAAGERKSYGLTLAFCKRAAIAQQVVRSSNPSLYCVLTRDSRSTA